MLYAGGKIRWVKHPVPMGESERSYFLPILLISVGVPGLVALLFFFPVFSSSAKTDLTFLPALNACLNGSTAGVLIAGFVAIRKKRIASRNPTVFRRPLSSLPSNTENYCFPTLSR